eukprot:COSAG04_NODE_637_length_11700_cov_478.131885_11_plen_147_part_00
MGPGGKVDAPELSLVPLGEIQEVSRVGAQGVTSKSKLLAREMPDLRAAGLRVDSGAARSRKGARARWRVDRRGPYASVGPEWKIQEVSRVGAQSVTSKSKLLAREMPDLRAAGTGYPWGGRGWLNYVCPQLGLKMSRTAAPANTQG